MSENRNPTVVAGGMLLLMLWGGLGLFFGKGKGSNHQNKNANPTQSRPQERKTQPPQDVRTSPQNQLVNTQFQAPQDPRPPISRKDPNLSEKSQKTPKGSSWEEGKYAFTFVLRLTHIHPVQPDGSLAKETVSVEELIARGKKAHLAKQELHLRVRGDARARWEATIKQKLRQEGITFSVTNEF